MSDLDATVAWAGKNSGDVGLHRAGAASASDETGTHPTFLSPEIV
jgi:hypothetical protein